MNVVCFGDSNTWGYDPRSYFGDRYPPESRWTDILAKATGWNVQNMGIIGLEIPQNTFIPPEQTDFLLILLGTNDFLQGATAEEAAKRIEIFLRKIPLFLEKNTTDIST